MESEKPKRQFKCPQCGRLTEYSHENSDRPFCSERCRLVDLGAWASEKYRVPTQEHADFAHPDLESDDED